LGGVWGGTKNETKSLKTTNRHESRKNVCKEGREEKTTRVANVVSGHKMRGGRG